MKIKSVKIKNYLSYGPDEQTYETIDGINFIVGENNNGKSNLISVYSVIRDCLLQKQISYNISHKSNPEGDVSLNVDFILDQKQISAMMAFLNFYPEEEYYKLFGNQLSISVSKTSTKLPGLIIRLGRLYIKEDLGSVNESYLYQTSFTPKMWIDFVKGSRTDGPKVAGDITKELNDHVGIIRFSSNFRVYL